MNKLTDLPLILNLKKAMFDLLVNCGEKIFNIRKFKMDRSFKTFKPFNVLNSLTT